MAVYIIIGFVILVFSFSRKNSLLVEYLILLFLFLLCALRTVNVGTDTYEYQAHYWYYAYDLKVETFFWYPLKLLRDARMSYQYGMAIQAFVILLFLHLSIRKGSFAPMLSLFLFYFLSYYANYSYNIVRQGMASMIALYGVINYEQQKKWWKFLLVIIIAFQFHLTAIVLAFYYIIDYFSITKSRKKYITTILIISFLVPLFYDLTNIVANSLGGIDLMSKYLSYSDTDHLKDSSFSVGRLLLNILYIFILYTGSIKNCNTIYFKAIIFGIIILNLSGSFVVLGRTAYYFLICQIIYLPLFMRERIFNSLVIYTYAIFIFLFNTIVVNYGGIAPYSSIID